MVAGAAGVAAAGVAEAVVAAVVAAAMVGGLAVLGGFGWRLEVVLLEVASM